MANRKLAIFRSLAGESQGVKRPQGWARHLAQALPLAFGLGLASLAWGQAAVEYSAMGARSAGAAVAAGSAVAPASGPMAVAAPGVVKKRGMASEGASSRADGPNCVGEMTAPSAVSVAVGKSSLLRLPEPVVKRTVGDPEVIDTRLVSAQMLYVLGVATGSTNMILQGKSGRCVVVDVQVGFDGAGLGAKIRELFPDENGVKVSSAADSLVLSGNVSDAMRASQVVLLANAYVRGGSSGGGGAAGGGAASSPRVVNMMAVDAPQQVMLEVKIAEVSKTLLDKLGSKFNATGTARTATFGLVSSFLFGAGGTLGGSMIGIDGENKDALVKILAEPMIMAISGQEASFLSGGKIFIPVSQSNAAGAATITLEEKEFGVGVRFTPTVLAGGRINLRVAPEVSEVDPNGIGVSSNTGLLTGTSILASIKTSRVSTTVQLFDGQSFAIGGLIKNNSTQNIKAFPALGQIPILGALFRSTDFQNERTELLIVVTPRLVKPLPPDYRLPTDAYSDPSMPGLFLGGKMEGEKAQAPEAGQKAPAAGEGKPAGGFEVK